MIRVHWTIVLIIVALLSVVGMRGQEAPPVLSSLAIMTLKQVASQVELTQLRAAIAIQQFQEAQAKMQATVKMYQIEGYDLDLQKMVYVPKPKPNGESK